MIVLLVDATNHRNDSVIDMIKDIGFQVVTGDWDIIENMNSENPKTIFLWDSEDIFEEEKYKKVDYVLEIFEYQEKYTEEAYAKMKKHFEVTTHTISLHDKKETAFRFNYLFKEWKDELENRQTVTNHEIKNIASEMITKSGLQVTLRLYCDFSNFLGRYTNYNQTMYIYPERIRLKRTREEAILQTKITVAHELGHAFDPDYDMLYDKFVEIKKQLNVCKDENEFEILFDEYKHTYLTLEKNAWNFAYQFLPKDVDKKHLEKRTKFGLQVSEEKMDIFRETLLERLKN